MPKAKDVPWTRELLERLLVVEGDEVWRLAEELGVTRATIYGKRKKVRDQGIEAALPLSRSGPRGARRQLQTLTEEMARTYDITVSNAGRGDVVQYTVTIPKRMAEIFVERFGRAVRFVPTEQGLVIAPVERFNPDLFPGWVPPEAYRENDVKPT